MNDHDAQRLEDTLRAEAKKLGLRIKITHDSGNQEIFIDSSLIPERATYTIDDEMFVVGRPIADLLLRILDDLQARLHTATHKAMAARDVRGRHQMLDEADRVTLHELFRDAEQNLLSRLEYVGSDTAAEVEKQRKRYEALVEKMFK